MSKCDIWPRFKLTKEKQLFHDLHQSVTHIMTLYVLFHRENLLSSIAWAFSISRCSSFCAYDIFLCIFIFLNAGQIEIGAYATINHTNPCIDGELLV